jgi:hypothetical protein
MEYGGFGRNEEVFFVIDRDLDALFSIGPRGSIAIATGGPMLLPASSA